MFGDLKEGQSVEVQGNHNDRVGSNVRINYEDGSAAAFGQIVRKYVMYGSGAVVLVVTLFKVFGG